MTDEDFKALGDPDRCRRDDEGIGARIRVRRGGMVLYHPGSRLRLGAHGVESVSNMLRRAMRQAVLFSRLVSHALDPVAPSWRSGTDGVAGTQICSL